MILYGRNLKCFRGEGSVDYSTNKCILRWKMLPQNLVGFTISILFFFLSM